MDLRFDSYRRSARRNSGRWAASDRGWAYLPEPVTVPAEFRDKDLPIGNWLHYPGRGVHVAFTPWRIAAGDLFRLGTASRMLQSVDDAIEWLRAMARGCPDAFAAGPEFVLWGRAIVERIEDATEAPDTLGPDDAIVERISPARAWVRRLVSHVTADSHTIRVSRFGMGAVDHHPACEVRRVEMTG